EQLLECAHHWHECTSGMTSRSSARHFASLATGFTQSDGNGLLPARDFLTRPPRPQSAPLALVHGFLDLPRRCFTVLRHVPFPPCAAFEQVPYPHENAPHSSPAQHGRWARRYR